MKLLVAKEGVCLGGGRFSRVSLGGGSCTNTLITSSQLHNNCGTSRMYSATLSGLIDKLKMDADPIKVATVLEVSSLIKFSFLN